MSSRASAIRPLPVDQTLTGTQAPPVSARALLRGYSLEVSSRDAKALDAAGETLPTSTEVYINWVPGDTHHRTIAAAAKLRAGGLVPVPHVGARYLASYTQLADFLARLAGEAGVSRCLTIGGDVDRPVGPYESSLQMLETGLFAKYGIKRIGIAGYPEGHPRIGPAALAAALDGKLARARDQGLEVQIVTQFCFEAAPILGWLRALRARGIAAPVRVGLAGPASITTLMKYALRCGVGNSVRALTLRGPAIARILSESTPDALIQELAAANADDATLGIAGLHLFSFGGLKRTAAWAGAV